MLSRTKTLSALAVLLLSTSALGHGAFAQTAGVAATGNTAAPVGANGNTPGTAGVTGNTPGGTTNEAAPGAETNPTTMGGTQAGNGTTGTGNPAFVTSPPAAGSSLPGSPKSGTYDLSNTVGAAISSSTELANAKRLVEIDAKKVDEARSAGRPVIGASASATRFDQATKIAFGSSAPITVLFDHTETLQAQVTDKLDLTGQIAAATSQAKLQQLADTFNYTTLSNARILQAQTIYYSVLRAQHQVQVAQAAKSTAEEQLDIATKTYNAGTGQKVDLLRASTQVATASQDLLSAQNRLNVANSNFNDLVGQPLSAPVSLIDSGEATTGVTFSNDDVTAPPTLKEIAIEDVDKIDINADIKTAEANRPELLTDAVEVRSAQKGIKLAHAGLEPSLSLAGTGDYYPTTSFQTPRQRVAAITATLNIPIYDGGATNDKVAEAKLKRDSAQASYNSDKTTIELYVRQAYFNLLTAAHQLSSANTALNDAIQARQLAQVRYDNQVSLYLEVTDAQSALVQAENNQLNAVYDYYIARAQYANALGTPNFGR